LKLIRNTLRDKLILRHNEKNIYWDNTVSLQKVQESLKVGTK